MCDELTISTVNLDIFAAIYFCEFCELAEDIEVMAQGNIISLRYTMSPSTVFCRSSIYN